jgi:hypothetical protein
MSRCKPMHNFVVGDNVLWADTTQVTFLNRPAVIVELIGNDRIKVEIFFNTPGFATTFPGTPVKKTLDVTEVIKI